MQDREKVIEGLRHCTAWAGLHECQPKFGSNCPYKDEADCKLALMRDALAMLKEQETQSVLSNRVCEAEPFRYVRKGFCPKCHQEMEWLLNRKYCGFCGQEVKWK